MTPFPEAAKNTAATPGTYHLFSVQNECNKIYEEQDIYFHNCVDKLLFANKWARPDIKTALDFLTMMVSIPDED